MNRVMGVLIIAVGIGSSAWAVDAADPISFIGKGSRFIAVEDFTIPANTSWLLAIRGSLVSHQPPKEQMEQHQASGGYCRFNIVKSPRTRVLPKDKAIVVKGAIDSALVFASEHIHTISCSTTGGMWVKATIGQLLQHLDGIFDFEEAPAEVID